MASKDSAEFEGGSENNEEDSFTGNQKLTAKQLIKLNLSGNH